jgi:hypothetical protein
LQLQNNIRDIENQLNEKDSDDEDDWFPYD